MNDQAPHRDDDFLAVPPAGEHPAAPALANPRRTRWATRLRGPAALVGAGVLAGGVIVGAAAHELVPQASATTASASTTTPWALGAGAADEGTTGAAPGQAGGQVGGPAGGQVGGQVGGQGPAGGAGGGAGGGGLDGEQHLAGTLSAVDGSTLTVTTPAGDQTFTVDTATEVVQDGQEAALSDLTSGEAVVLHVYPSGSGWAVERVVAGTSDGGAGSGGTGPRPGGPSDDDPGEASTTTT